MHDTLEYLGQDPINRQYHHGELTFSMVYQYSRACTISHDEVVHGKGSLLRKARATTGSRPPRCAPTWPCSGPIPASSSCSWAASSRGRDGSEEQSGLPWWLLEYPLHRGTQQLVKDLNGLQADFPALYQRDQDPGGFEWLIGDDADHNMLVFLRRDEAGDPVVVVLNLSPQPSHGYRGAPAARGWERLEVLNSDARSPESQLHPQAAGNWVAIATAARGWELARGARRRRSGLRGQRAREPGTGPCRGAAAHGRDHWVRLTVPPLGAVVLVPARLRES